MLILSDYLYCVSPMRFGYVEITFLAIVAVGIFSLFVRRSREGRSSWPTWVLVPIAIFLAIPMGVAMPDPLRPFRFIVFAIVLSPGLDVLPRRLGRCSAAHLSARRRIHTEKVRQQRKIPRANQTLVVPREARDVGIGATPLETRQCYPVGASAAADQSH